MEELQAHLAVARQTERALGVRAVEDERLAVDVVHRTIQIRRPDDVRVRNLLEHRAFGRHFAFTVLAPHLMLGIEAQPSVLDERLQVGGRVHRARTDHHIRVERDRFQGARQIIHILRVVGGHVDHGVEMLAAQHVPQCVPIGFDDRDAFQLLFRIAVQHHHLFAQIGKIPRDVFADEYGSPRYQNPACHFAPFLL